MPIFPRASSSSVSKRNRNNLFHRKINIRKKLISIKGKTETICFIAKLTSEKRLISIKAKQKKIVLLQSYIQEKCVYIFYKCKLHVCACYVSMVHKCVIYRSSENVIDSI